MADDELPKAGARVRFRPKGKTLWETGTVEFQWWCCGEIALEVITPEGGQLALLPGLGDEVSVIG